MDVNPWSLSDIDLSTAANDARATALFSSPTNHHRIPANTPPVSRGLRSCICRRLLLLMTNGNVGQAPLRTHNGQFSMITRRDHCPVGDGRPMTCLTPALAMARPMWFRPSRWMCVVVVALSLVTGTTGQATTSIQQSAVVEVDQATVNQILDLFRKAEAAIAAGNLDDIMALYATQYNYHGLKQADVRKIWFDLFEEYRDLGEVHFFSKIVKVGSGSNALIEVTCTGSLSGISKTSGLRVPIDSWYAEVHFLTLEGGVWRIRGNAGDRPRAMPFGTAPHPLF